MITFKNTEPQDLPFIEAVYRSTRENELVHTNWPELQKQAFIIMQNTARMAEYKSKYPGSTYQLILYKNKPAGNLFLWETEEQIRLVDISLLPAFRGKGIAKNILTDLINKAKTAGKIFSLHVTPDNPAKKLYESFGLQKVSETKTHDYMEWKEEEKQ